MTIDGKGMLDQFKVHNNCFAYMKGNKMTDEQEKLRNCSLPLTCYLIILDGTNSIYKFNIHKRP